ncbi:recombinase family protein [bacterium]|nr:recombinase family protein [bacterium]
MAHASELNTILSSALNISMISTIQSTPLYQNEEFLRQAYHEKGLSIRQIAAECGSARETIKQALKRSGANQTPRLNLGQVGYGYKLKNGRLVPNASETKITRKIIGMRTAGSSYGAIADWLNSEGFPTKNRARGWSAATIYKIIKLSSSR